MATSTDAVIVEPITEAASNAASVFLLVLDMAAPETIDEAIEQAALGPKRMRIKNEEFESHSIPDLIKAKQHEDATEAASKPHLGMWFKTKFIPPGSG